MNYRETEYGFEWGLAKITRFFSDKKAGWVTLRIEISIRKEDSISLPAKVGSFLPCDL